MKTTNEHSAALRTELKPEYPTKEARTAEVRKRRFARSPSQISNEKSAFIRVSQYTFLPNSAIFAPLR